jgi:hypothetical protein
MKKLLFILFLYGGTVHAQTAEVLYKVASIATMKTYYGKATRIRVVSVNEDYALCPTCTANEVDVFAGASGRKWKRIPDAVTLRNSKSPGDSITYIKSNLELLFKRLIAGGSISFSPADSTLTITFPVSMTTSQRNAIVSPAAGRTVYDTDLNKLYTWNGSTWNALW